ncbi:chemotaxis protein CheW [Noviherbaspirillum autotrophicum]|uniref:Chemotaxis protein CheW n=1 Tax=Noviherbaspirillum autotrophicum TaxID=709839 RepID=A0A0C1YA34_9BURK|nr:chemotaxis protein CheW [Noviherbaspirillum autotrophicum]
MSALVETKAAGNLPAASKAVEHTQYLTFMLGGEMFAIGILAVKEIIEYGGLTEVPMMPECIRGVINLRGAVVPVLDLAARFGKAATTVTKRTCIVIVEIANSGEQQVVGVMVDAVNAVLDIAAADVEPPPAFGAKIRTDFIEGMGKVNGKFVILLNLGEILSLDDIATLANVNTMAQLLIGSNSAGVAA